MCSDVLDKTTCAPLNDKSQIFRRWLCLLSLSVLLLFWFGVVVTRDDASPAAAHSSGLRGYTRIRAGGKGQVRAGARARAVKALGPVKRSSLIGDIRRTLQTNVNLT